MVTELYPNSKSDTPGQYSISTQPGKSHSLQTQTNTQHDFPNSTEGLLRAVYSVLPPANEHLK